MGISIRTEVPILNLDGNPWNKKGEVKISDTETEDAIPWTLTDALTTALLRDVSTKEGEKKETQQERFDRYLIAVRIKQEEPVILMSEDIDIIKKQVHAFFPTNMLGPIYLLLKINKLESSVDSDEDY